MSSTQVGVSTLGRLGRTLMIIAGLALAGPALGQAPSKPAAQPTTPPPEPVRKKVVEPGPYVKQGDYEYWAFTTRLQVYQKTWRDFSYQIPFETLTIVYPMLPATASSAPRFEEAKGTLDLGGPAWVEGAFLDPGVAPPAGELPHRPERLDRAYSGKVYHSGTNLAKFAVGEIGTPRSTERIGLSIDIPVRTGNVYFDEERALHVPWPKGPWPEVPASTFEPQRWVDYQLNRDGTIQKYNEDVFLTLIDRWLEGQNPLKDFTPVGLAKVLMGGIVRDVQPAINWLNFEIVTPSGSTAPKGPITPWEADFYIGLQLRGAEYAARTTEGASEWDVACLGAAIFRRCGLPARVVVGFDKSKMSESDRQKQRDREAAGLFDQKLKLRAWIEFYLYDEANNTGNWVVCDPYRLRKSMGKPPPLNQKWKFFGNHDELADIIPFSFHFAPPTDVKTYSAPGFWGLLVTPNTPEFAYPAIGFTARKTAVPKDAPRDNVNKGNPFGR